MNHKKLVIILGLGFILMTVVAFAILTLPQFRTAEPTVSAKVVKSEDKPVLGKPCTYKGSSIDNSDTKSLQCYYYGPSDNRKGIWLTPDIDSLRLTGMDFRTSIAWKTYTNIEYGFSFQTPADTSVDVMTKGGPIWQGRIIPFTNDGAIDISFDIKPKDDINFNEPVESASVTDTQGFVTKSGLEGKVRKTFYKTNLDSPTLTYLFNLSDQYDLLVTYNKGYGSDWDYINDTIVQSLKPIK